MVKTRAELRSSHGTPEEFEHAVWEAHAQLFVTTDEANTAIGKYREEYAAAAPENEVPMEGKNVHQVTICCNVAEQDDKFALIVYRKDGGTLGRLDHTRIQSDFQFDTAAEAQKAGVEIIDYGLYEMGKYKTEVYGGKHETPQDQAPHG